MTMKKAESLEFSGDLFFENRIASEWISTSDAAKYLGTSPNAIRILVCRGKIKYRKFGRHLRFRIRDLNGLLQKGA